MSWQPFRDARDALAASTRWGKSFEARRDDAFAVWQATHDFPTLTDDEIEARLTAVTPQQSETDEGVEAPVHQRMLHEEVRGKADSPMLLRRLVESLGNLPERRHLEEVESFLAAHPIDGAKQAIAQTLERMRTDVALRDRLMPQVSAWLQRR